MTVYLVSALMKYDQQTNEQALTSGEAIHSCMFNFTDGGVDLFTPEGFEILHQLISKKFVEDNPQITKVTSVQMLAISNLGDKMISPEMSGNA